ncbi:rRNA maturation RNase YbeY [uncultured Jannaschia sp.]|uniref:rRNA maturation RNase YbeY n=1 Tax=uncultured Jannaschia sp. TaxID=293347 RepID=UPI002639E0DE|nr:rRNA maturation RNase YbeY [uncultured Jannaschia sp.]
MSHVVDVIVEDDRWQEALERLAGIAVPAALAGLEDCEVAVMGCDDARIAELNGSFRGKARPTNVLSWPSETRRPDVAPLEPELGDIAIAYETCAREAAEQDKSFEAHVIHLLVHATLHLLGHDHGTASDAKRMEAEEVRILGGLGYADPYASDMDAGAGNRAGSGTEAPRSDGQGRIV